MILSSTHQPIGFALPNWQPRLPPEATVLIGRTCRLEPLDPARHADDLCHAFLQPEAATVWTYLPSGPFSATQSNTFRQHLADISGQADPLHFAVIDQQTQQAIGSVALMRIDATNGVAEIGAVTFSPQLQHTTAATEAHFLLLQYLFDTLDYRRCEWKCDQLNAPSRKAATRLGFQFEGLFRQILVYKGRNRDTAWHSIIDSEWPAIRAALICWLAPDNFTADGQQKKSLVHFKTDVGTE